MEMKELFGKTIGIIGYGSIGQKVAVIANAFGMNVLAYSRSALKEKIQSDEVTYAAVDEILGKSDIVTIHCPLNKDSEKMCNKEFFTKMKKDSLFINTSRGGVVNQEDLM